jgi:NDP-sugar pyrophosphorylase family protein
MKALVLAGGYATRLRPITYVIPKLLFPLLGKPMIYWTLENLKSFDVKEVVLAVNYLADSLRAIVGDKYKGMRIRYSLEDIPLGTGGPIKLASRTVDLGETFIVMNGDIIADIDLQKMLMHHEETRALITDALYEVKDPTRFGSGLLDSRGRIIRFVEKPPLNQAVSHLVNAGIYLIEPEVLKMIPSERKVSLEREIFPLLARKHRLAGFLFSGYWFDIGSLSDYRKANFELLRKDSSKGILRERFTRVAKNAVVKPPVYLGERSVIEGRATAGPCLLIGNNGNIRREARVSESILFDGVIVGERSEVSGSVIGSNVAVGEGVRIEPGSVISPNVQISGNVRIGRNAIIHSHKEINTNVKPGANIM